MTYNAKLIHRRKKRILIMWSIQILYTLNFITVYTQFTSKTTKQIYEPQQLAITKTNWKYKKLEKDPNWRWPRIDFGQKLTELDILRPWTCNLFLIYNTWRWQRHTVDLRTNTGTQFLTRFHLAKIVAPKTEQDCKEYKGKRDDKYKSHLLMLVLGPSNNWILFNGWKIYETRRR